MYLRKNRVRSGAGHRIYLSVAHNVWSASEGGDGRCQSRPVSLLSLGRAEQVDRIVAEEIVMALEQVYGRQSHFRGSTERKIRNTAHEVRRKHQPELKTLASHAYGLRARIPEHEDRIAYLTALIQARSLEPERSSYRDESSSSAIAGLESYD